MDNKEEKLNQRIVLIPIDFSNYSIQACEFGLNYAREKGARVVLMHAFMTPFVPTAISLGESFIYQSSKDSYAIMLMMEKAKADLDSFSELVENKMNDGSWPHLEYTVVLRDGLPEEEIIDYCKQHKPLLVVMGTRGKDQKDLDLIGSVTAEVIDRSKTPVFAIPENTPLKNFSDIKRLAFGTSFDHQDILAADVLFKMFESFDVAFYLFHVTSKPETWDEVKLGGIKAYFEKLHPSIIIQYDIIDEKDFTLNLESFIRNNEIDVISMTTHKRNIFYRIFNSSMARKMLFHTDTPLLILYS